MKKKFPSKFIQKKNSRTAGKDFVTNGTSDIDCTISSYTEVDI